jgi:hypothetical protein
MDLTLLFPSSDLKGTHIYIKISKKLLKRVRLCQLMQTRESESLSFPLHRFVNVNVAA